jgi:hypothetical protein
MALLEKRDYLVSHLNFVGTMGHTAQKRDDLVKSQMSCHPAVHVCWVIVNVKYVSM